MKTMLHNAMAFIFLLSSLNAFAAADFYQSTNPNQRQKVVFNFGGSDEWKRVDNEVDGQDYGSKSKNNTWLLKGGEGFVYKNNGSDITSVTLHYRIYKDGTTPPSFSDINLPWAEDYAGTDHQRWASTAANIDILAAVNSPGTWYVEFYYSAATNGVDCSDPIYFSNNGNNYKLHFTADSTFPVELTSFSGNSTGNSVLLQWTTASEQNTKSHIIERSANGKDNFTVVGSIKAAGNSINELEYRFIDRQPLPVNYYRLQTIDNDGKFQFSKVISVKSQVHGGLTKVYPVPAKSNVTLDFRMTIGNNVVLTIMDISGKTMLHKTFEATKGSNSIDVDIRNFPEGNYLLQLNDGVKIHSKLITKN